MCSKGTTDVCLAPPVQLQQPRPQRPALKDQSTVATTMWLAETITIVGGT